MKLIDISKVMPTLAVVAQKSMRTVEKNLPAILAAGSIGCLGGAVVMAAVGMHKADQKVQAEEQRRSELVPEYNNTELTIKEKVQLTWMEFVPAAAFTTAAVTLIILSKRKEHEKYLALMGAYELSKQALADRKEAESDVLSEDNVKLIDERTKALTTTSMDISEDLVPHVTRDGDEILFIEKYTRTAFYAKEAAVMHAFNKVNHALAKYDRATIGDLLKDVGQTASPASEMLGWCVQRGSLVEPCFEAVFLNEDTSRPAVLIDYSREPEYDCGVDKVQW